MRLPPLRWAAWSDGTAHALAPRARGRPVWTLCGMPVLPEIFERPPERRCAACEAAERGRAAHG